MEGLVRRPTDRPWVEMLKGRSMTHHWLAKQLRPYGILPRNLLIGEQQAKGYVKKDFGDTFRRYISRAELDALRIETRNPEPGATPAETPRPVFPAPAPAAE